MGIDWTQIYKKYKGQWVALKSDEKTVVGFGKTAKLAHIKATKSGYSSPILTFFPSQLKTYIGTAHEV